MPIDAPRRGHLFAAYAASLFCAKVNSAETSVTNSNHSCLFKTEVSSGTMTHRLGMLGPRCFSKLIGWQESDLIVLRKMPHLFPA